jgi:cytochrome oxidase Cu insertion factor (SCO1/SenC/PrrC family)
MNPRTVRLLLVMSAFVVGLILCFAVVLLVTGRGPVPIAAPAAIGGPFRLTDQNGQTITDGDLKGRPFLVFFGFTHCPEVCPDCAVRHLRDPQQARTRCRQGQRAVHHGRSGTRHAGGS